MSHLTSHDGLKPLWLPLVATLFPTDSNNFPAQSRLLCGFSSELSQIPTLDVTKVTFSFVRLQKHLTDDVMLASRFFVSYRYDWGRYHWECRINR